MKRVENDDPKCILSGLMQIRLDMPIFNQLNLILSIGLPSIMLISGISKPMMKNLLPLFLLLCTSLCAPAEDLVKFYPAGYSNHKYYSGYLNFSTGHFHYVFFDSQHDPDNDPVVLWLNGGPGCSSMIGMVYENGPFVLMTNSFGFELNNQSWNLRANVLYIESPGEVGFSKGFRNNNNSDETVAIDNYRALIDFYRKFPNLKKNPFFISGQSYAGIYIPFLAQQILRMNRLPETQTVIPLKGIMVGNACTNPRECYEPSSDTKVDGMSIYQYEYLHKHGYLTDRRYEDIQAACILGYLGEFCQDLRSRTNKQFDQTKTIINNIYEPCWYQVIPNSISDTPTPSTSRRMIQSSRLQNLNKFEPVPNAYTTCQDIKGIQNFFNQPTIHEYFHVDPVKFDLCSDLVASNYHMNENGSQQIYPRLVREGIRIWIYSGDLDANVPIVGTLNWLYRLKQHDGWPVMEPWREWWQPGLHKHEDQVAGMVWKLRGITFVSVKGAGHLVPKDKRREARTMFETFMDGVDLPYKSP